MTEPSTIPIVIDTDNALGPPRRSIEKIFGGDVDDAFAIAFLLSNSKLISAIYGVSGNADSKVCRFERTPQRVRINIVTAIDATKIGAIFFNSLNNSIPKSPLNDQLTTNLS